MEIKSFNEFVSSLTQEDMAFISGSDDENPASFSGNLFNHDDFTEFCSFLNGLEFGVTLRLLQCYHEWLMKQFEQ